MAWDALAPIADNIGEPREGEGGGGPGDEGLRESLSKWTAEQEH